MMYVGSTILRSASEDVKVGASGNFEEGNIQVRSSVLLAATDINITASLSLRRGTVDVEGTSLLAGGSIAIQTGDLGRTRARGNGLIQAGDTIAITSSGEGETRVAENRIQGQNEVRISSGRYTNASRNIFLGSGEVLIEGPLCESQENIPDVVCVPSRTTAEASSAEAWADLKRAGRRSEIQPFGHRPTGTIGRVVGHPIRCLSGRRRPQQLASGIDGRLLIGWPRSCRIPYLSRGFAEARRGIRPSD